MRTIFKGFTIEASPIKAGMNKNLKAFSVLIFLKINRIRTAVAPKQWMQDRQPHEHV